MLLSEERRKSFFAGKVFCEEMKIFLCRSATVVKMFQSLPIVSYRQDVTQNSISFTKSFAHVILDKKQSQILGFV